MLLKLVTFMVLCFSAVDIKSESCAGSVSCVRVNVNSAKHPHTENTYSNRNIDESDLFFIKI